MACNMKTMLKVGLGMLLVVGTAYVALPEFRDWIHASSPILLFLLCPLSLLVMMSMMQGETNQVGQVQTLPQKNGHVSSSNLTDVKTS